MNDCLWLAIGACEEQCKCTRYLSMNSEEGQRVGMLWERKVDEVLKPLAVEFARENGFGGGGLAM